LKANLKRWLYLAAGTIMMVILGLVYAWSVFVAPLEEAFGWDRAQTSVTFTVCMIFFVVGLIVSGMLGKKLSKRVITVIAALCLFAGFALCARVNTLPGLYIAYGVLVGFGVGIANNALVSTIVKWFPDNTGLASGILMMGFGLGGIILGPLATSLMDSIGWRNTFLGFGIVFSVILAAGSIAVVMPPDEKNSVAAPDAGNKNVSEKKREYSVSEIIRRPSFWLYIVWFSLVMGGGLLVIGHAAPYIQSLGEAASFAAMAAGLLSLCNGIGRVLTGLTYDKAGLRKSMFLMNLYMVAAAALLIASSLTGSVAAALGGFVFTGLSYGGGPPTSSTFALSFYGKKDFAMNYSAVSAGMIPGAVIGPMLAGALYKSSGDYMSSFAAMLVFALASLVCACLIRRP
jgi:OFA family oxalate/formate antiporter-like MFS transporter